MHKLSALCGGRAPSALLFDLDGTLVDSVPDLAAAVDACLIGCGFAPAGESRVRDWVGNGAQVLVQRALQHACHQAGAAKPEPALLKQALEHFYQAYEADCCSRSGLYPGVREALDQWQQQGLAMACVTNKPRRFADKMLAHFGLDRLLPVVVGGDCLPVRKPDPQPLAQACRELGTALADALMIGDSRNDVLAARAAAVPVVCVSYGYNYGAPVATERPDAMVDSLAELL